MILLIEYWPLKQNWNTFLWSRQIRLCWIFPFKSWGRVGGREIRETEEETDPKEDLRKAEGREVLGKDEISIDLEKIVCVC